MRAVLVSLFFFLACYAGAQKPVIDVAGLKPVTVSCTPVKDQYMSATCWSFSSVSLLESELLKKGKGEVDLSEMFIARYSMVRKIHRHLKLKGSNFFTPGGQFHDAVWVMKNFGLVPEEVYSGKGRKEIHHNHGELDTLLSRFVRVCIANGITELNPKQEKFVDSLLDHYLGKVPAMFDYRGKTYTPQSFQAQFLEIEPDDYVELTSYTHHPFYTKFILEDKYNWTGDEYWNVPLADFIRITNTALDNGFTVGWDGDADDKGFLYQDGQAYLPDPLKHTLVTERQQAFENQITLLNHMMHIVGRTKEQGGIWYYVKNSWGNYSNSLGGYLFMREDYFKIRTVAIIVNKQAIPYDIRSKLGL